MPNHRFTDNRNRNLIVRFDGSSHKLYEDLGDKTKRLDENPMKPSIITALLQEIIKLSTEVDAARSPDYMSDKRQRLLDEIEWFASYPGSKTGFCLWCQHSQRSGHHEDCRWLAARGGGK
jgi:hypothetical protein